jgi:DNA polymerase-3 subunit epsilon
MPYENDYWEPDHSTARRRAIEQARLMLSRDPLFLDSETTGLDSEAEAVEIVVIDAAGNELLNSLIHPVRPIPSEATRIHGITDGDVVEAPDFVEVLPQLAHILEDRTLIVYNAEYDWRILRQSAWAHDLDLGCHIGMLHGPYCAMKMYAEFWGEWDDWHKSYRWQRLSNAARQQGIDLPADLHRARADAELTRLLVLKMAAEEVDDGEQDADGAAVAAGGVRRWPGWGATGGVGVLARTGRGDAAGDGGREVRTGGGRAAGATVGGGLGRRDGDGAGPGGGPGRTAAIGGSRGAVASRQAEEDQADGAKCADAGGPGGFVDRPGPAAGDGDNRSHRGGGGNPVPGGPGGTGADGGDGRASAGVSAMKPMGFPEQTKVLQRPPSMSDEECAPLPVWSDGSMCMSLWRPSWRERLSMLLFGRVWLFVVSGESQPPVALDGQRSMFRQEEGG